MDNSTKRIASALYIILYLTTILGISMIQIYENANVPYNLHIEYNKHTSITTGSLFGTSNHHESDATLIVGASIMRDGYETALAGIKVSDFPLWVDTSDWAANRSVTISGSTYVISDLHDRWSVRHSIEGIGSVTLYYSKDLGAFIGSSTFTFYADSSGVYSSSNTQIQIAQSNIDGFRAKISGANVAIPLLVVSGVFIEIPIIVSLNNQLTKKRSTRKSQQTPTNDPEAEAVSSKRNTL